MKLISFFTIFILTFNLKVYTNEISEKISLINADISNIEYQFPQIDFSKFEKFKSDKLLGINDDDFEEKIKIQIHNRLNALHPNVKNGISFSIINSNLGQIDYANGYSNKFQNILLTEDMPLQMASITKVYTATLIFKLQDEGKLNIKDEISKYLPPIPNVNMSLKIENLLNHSSQIFDFMNQNVELLFATYLYPELVPELDLILQNLRPYQFLQSVENEYSNTNYTLLAKIVEIASEMTFEDYLEESILNPLGLNNTYFVGKKVLEPINIANGWFEDDYNYFGISRVNQNDLYKVYETSWGMGNLVATPSDVAKFGYELMKGNIISLSAFNQMTEKFSFDQQSNSSFGNGLFYSRLGQFDCYHHNGSLFGYQSYLWMIPSQDICFVININTGTASFAYNNTGMSDLLESILFEIFDITAMNPFSTEIANINIFEEVNDNIISYGETIEVEFSLRDISKRFDIMFANFKLVGELHKIEDMSPIIIDTLFSDGYSYFNQKFKIRIKDNIESDNVHLAIQIDDITGEYDLINLPFRIPLNSNFKSIQFGGFENRVEIPTNTFKLDGSWTVEMDFNLIGQGKQIGNDRLQAFFYHSQTLGIIVFNGLLAVTFVTENGSNPIYLYQTPLERNKWQHLAVTYDGVNNCRIYLDGLRLNTPIVNQNQPNGKLLQEIRPLLCVIGNGPNKVSAPFAFEGLIDNFRLWNKELSPQELNQQISSNQNDDLYFAYNFDSGFNNNVIDNSGKNNGIRYSLFNTQTKPVSSIEKRNNQESIKIYPLPANNKITIESDEKITFVALFDLGGNEIFSQKLNFSNKSEIDISNIITGTYVIFCKTEKTDYTKKFIKN